MSYNPGTVVTDAAANAGKAAGQFTALSQKRIVIPGSGGTLYARYTIRSPVNANGTYTESVRELTPGRVAQYRARGYLVEPTALALRNPVTIKSQQEPAVQLYRRERRGFRGMQPTTVSNRELRSIRKSEYSPRRIVSEPRLFQAYVPPSQRPGYTGDRIPSFGGSNRPPVSQVNIPDRPTPSSNPHQSVFDAIFNRPSSTSRPAPTIDWANDNPPPPQGPTIPQPYRPIYVQPQHIPGIGTPPAVNIPPNGNSAVGLQQLRAEIQTIHAWLTEVNDRTSRQLIQIGQDTTSLGQATVDRHNEIRKLDAWVKNINKRVSESLVGLGEAVTAASAAAGTAAEAAAANKAAIEANKAKGIIEQFKDFFSDASGLGKIWDYGKWVLIGIVVLVVLKMVISRGRVV